jgi:hypothetical protein
VQPVTARPSSFDRLIIEPNTVTGENMYSTPSSRLSLYVCFEAVKPARSLAGIHIEGQLPTGGASVWTSVKVIGAERKRLLGG